LEQVVPVPAVAPVDLSKHKSQDDHRIGLELDDPLVKFVSYPDGCEYRVENGVIVGRV
jgi:hypothetical protein